VSSLGSRRWEGWLRVLFVPVLLSSARCTLIEDATDPELGGFGEGSSDFEAARGACVDRINAFRATEDLPPLARWTDAEGCTEEQSKLDSEVQGAHENFGMCGERAQNTCPNWNGDVDEVIDRCLQAMWDEGPGEPFSEHGHYLNMSSRSYTKVACAFFEMDGGRIWSNQNFR
jgi:hypothetical protein